MSFHERLRIAMAAGGKRRDGGIGSGHRLAEGMCDVLGDRAERLGPLRHRLGEFMGERRSQADAPIA
jgi:hypothetical protein